MDHGVKCLRDNRSWMGHEEALWQAWLVAWGLKYLSNGSGAIVGGFEH